MDSNLFSQGYFNIVSDITAGAFLILLVFFFTVQPARHTGRKHLLAAALLTLCGIFIRLFAWSMVEMPGDSGLNTGIYRVLPSSSMPLHILSFVLITLGIAESVTYVIYINNNGSKNGLRRRFVANGIVILAGAVLLSFTNDKKVLTLCILAEFGYYLLDLRKNWPDRTSCEFARAALAAITTFALALVFDRVKLTGLGLSMMLTILSGQYFNHIVRELAENEAALAKSRMQLLANQISPHYIYNSLQSIEGLCDSDPEKAREAIDAFSEYLRGNLENLTQEELIPFERELEHTRAYLELERLSGSRRFVVEYDLMVTDFMLPPLVLQPVVENAVKHGTIRTSRTGEPGADRTTLITIATHKRDGDIYIEVTDRVAAGDGTVAAITTAVADSAPLGTASDIANHSKHKSVGLDNVRTRLAIQCGGTLAIGSSEDGTKVTIVLPESDKERLNS